MSNGRSFPIKSPRSMTLRSRLIRLAHPEGTFGTYRPTKAGENLVVALGEAKGKSLLQGR